MWFHCLMKLSKECMGKIFQGLLASDCNRKNKALLVFRGRMFLFVFVTRQDHIS